MTNYKNNIVGIGCDFQNEGDDNSRKLAIESLSGGEKQRLALARALSTTPDFLFLDEPTAHLDALSTNIIEKILLKISKNGTKVLFISHDINQVKRLGEDIIFMHKGKVQEFNKVKSFFKRQKSIYAKAFVEGKIII